MLFGGHFRLICQWLLISSKYLTNEFLDLKFVEKEVLVEMFEQIVQYIMFEYVVWRPF